MTYEQDLTRITRKYRRQNNLDPIPATVYGYTTDGTGRILVQEPRTDGRLSAPFPVLPPAIPLPLQAGDSVLLEIFQKQLRIASKDVATIQARGGNPLTLAQVSAAVNQADLLTLQVTANGTMILTVAAWNPVVNGTAYQFPGASQDMTSYLPAAGQMRYAVLAVKNDYTTLEVTTSTARAITDMALGVADIQECLTALTVTSTPVRAIKLVGGMTSITPADLKTNGVDLRQLVNFTGGDLSILAYLPPSTYKTVQDAETMQMSAGWLSGGAITDNGNGTIAVATGTGLIRATNSSVATLYFCNWSANAALALTNNVNNWVYISYNSGTPIVAASTSEPDYNTGFPLAKIYRNGTELHIFAQTKLVINDHPGLTNRMLQEVFRFVHVSGGAVTDLGTQHLAVSAGVWWQGLTRFTTTALDTSAAGRFSNYYRNGSGGWTEVTGQAQWDNTHYDDGTGTLHTLTAAHYGVYWMYVGADNDYHLQFGQGDYTLSQAQATTVPTAPVEVQTDSACIARLIFKKSDTTLTQIDVLIQGIVIPSPGGGSVTFGAAGDIGVETFGASAAAGASGKVADAGHIHQLPLVAFMPGGRLTLASGTPVTTADQTAKTTLYYTPYLHNQIMLYNGSTWDVITFAELSIAVPATTDTNYDVFCYNNSGTATLELLAWTNGTTRATALAYQDGRLVKSGTATRLYLGSMRTTSVSGQTESSVGRRFVQNYYNRRPCVVQRIHSGTNYTYASSTWRPCNNDTANRVELINGVAEDALALRIDGTTNPQTASANCEGMFGIGVNSTSSPSSNNVPTYVNGTTLALVAAIATYNSFPPVGYTYYQSLESSVFNNNVDFYGTNGSVAWTLLHGVWNA